MNSIALASDPISLERDSKYKEWLLSKSLRDKTLDLLGKLDKSRSSFDEKLKEVAISIAAVEKILDNGKSSRPAARNNTNSVGKVGHEMEEEISMQEELTSQEQVLKIRKLKIMPMIIYCIFKKICMRFHLQDGSK